MGGLGPLLEYALDNTANPNCTAIAVACDMPYVTPELLARLCSHASQRPIVAPQHPKTLKWEPLYARYTPLTVLPLLAECCADGNTSLQRLLARAKADVLPMNESEWLQLKDWDYPSDVEE
jgi:molybdopterin-guanine dinucleotide biosynthesis protein A